MTIYRFGGKYAQDKENRLYYTFNKGDIKWTKDKNKALSFVRPLSFKSHLNKLKTLFPNIEFFQES
jgi:hypothetical protein